MDVNISGDTAPTFTDPQQLVDFSYIPKINALLEDVTEQQEDHDEDGTTDHSMDHSTDAEEQQPGNAESDQDMDISDS